MPNNWVPLSKDRDARDVTPELRKPECTGFNQASPPHAAGRKSTEWPPTAQRWSLCVSQTVRVTPADGGAEILLRKPIGRPRCLVHRGFVRRFADADSRDAVAE